MADIVVQFRGTIYENGYGQLAQKVMRDKSIHAVSKAIYAYLVSFAGQDGTAFPSVQLMMEELGIKSEDTFYKYRKQLVSAGYITIEQQQRSKGQFYNNVYIIEMAPYPNLSSTVPTPKLSSTVKSSTKKLGTTSNRSLKVSNLKHDQKGNNKEGVVVDAELIIQEIENRLGRPIRSLYKLLPAWLQTYGKEKLIAKAEYISARVQNSSISNVVGAFRSAVLDDWDTNMLTNEAAACTDKDERYNAFYKLFPDE